MAVTTVTQFRTSKGKLFDTEAEANSEEARDELVDLLKFAIREAVSQQDLEEEQIDDIVHQFMNHRREITRKLNAYDQALGNQI
jgi:acetyl-CoA carboxylase carboxyltransferase component